MPRTRSICLSVAAFVTLTSSALAATFDFAAVINSDQEIPASNSPATGTATGTYDDVANTFSFSWSITGLVGAPASPGAHIHAGFAGENGPIVFGFNDPDGTWDPSGSATWSGLNADEVTRLFDGGFYLNFHTDQFQPGEVRGQILLVPSAGVSAAMLSAMGIVGIRRRR